MKTTGMGWRARAGLALIALLVAGAANAQGTQPAAAAPAAQNEAAPAPQQKIFKNEELDQMMAPVALYPDSVLSQILMACTYPSDVTEAVKWSAAHKDAKGDAAVSQVENEEWDPSVKSLVAFPQVLDQLGKQPDWVQKTGDAFLAQPEDVMASIQRLRQQAQKAGNLKSNEQQKVVTKQVPVETAQTTTTTSTQPAATTNTTIIEIQPSNPETVYVPAYNPTTVYGSWAYPSYPPPYWPPSPYYYPGYVPGAAFATGVMWGLGVAAIGSCWGGFGWGHGDVDINVNKYNSVNRNNQISNSGNRGGNQKWNHNANNRRGTPYADNRSRQQYGLGGGGADNRGGYRGDASRDESRQRAQQSFNSSTGFQGGNRSGSGTGANRGGGANAANRGTASAGNRGGGQGNFGGGGGGSRPSSSSMSSGSRSNAFSGASSGGGGQREMSRGQSSQRSMSSSGGRGSSAGQSASRSAPSRGGGGGGGGRGGGGGGRRR
jgi:hypothetical protein